MSRLNEMCHIIDKEDRARLCVLLSDRERFFHANFEIRRFD